MHSSGRFEPRLCSSSTRTSDRCACALLYAIASRLYSSLGPCCSGHRRPSRRLGSCRPGPSAGCTQCRRCNGLRVEKWEFDGLEHTPPRYIDKDYTCAGAEVLWGGASRIEQCRPSALSKVDPCGMGSNRFEERLQSWVEQPIESHSSTEGQPPRGKYPNHASLQPQRHDLHVGTTRVGMSEQ